MKRLLTPLVMLLLLLCSCSGEYHESFQPSSFQVMGNAEELWLFVEVDRIVYRSNAAYDTPKAVPFGHTQEVIILSKDGIQRHTPLAGINGVTFHPNISYIFRDEGDFYLYEGESKQYLDSIFKWENDHFSLLPIEKNVNFIGKYVLKGDYPISKKAHKNLSKMSKKIHWTDVKNEFNLLTEKAGWKHIFADSYIGDSHFEWNEKSITISYNDENNHIVILVRADHQNMNKYIIPLRHNNEIRKMTEAEYKELRKMKIQTGYKK